MGKNLSEDFMARRLSAQAALVIDEAKECALSLGHKYLGTEHLLAGMLRTPDSRASRLLRRYDVDEARVISGIRETIGVGSCDGQLVGYTPRVKEAFDMASDIAIEGTGIIDTETLLRAILIDKDSLGTALLRRMGINVGVLLVELSKGGKLARTEEKQKVTHDTPLLSKLGRDLTDMAAKGELDPCIGRDQEMLRMLRVLCRRSKNNPCLVGEPGVGKTALVEGLAKKISMGDVPECLRGQRVVSLDMASVVAGSKYRGEFEDKVKKLLEEVKLAKNVILFIDEVHTILGAGGAEGAIDASNIMKPIMARGEIRIIGATTFEEYKKTIERDGALDRRFQKIQVKEPSVPETIHILKGIKDRYEDYHGIYITEEALVTAVDLSARYMSGRFLPDKAIDLMDEASAMACIDGKARLLPEDVAFMCSNMTGIPVGKIGENEMENLLGLEVRLAQNIIGQDRAIAKVCACIRRGRVGMKPQGRPQAVLMFAGTTGVGKTELAKAVAMELAGKDGLIRIDMAEYGEKHSVSRLIGSPPGYVGHDNGGMLVDRVRRNPYSVVLFDEVDKASGEVRNLLLSILDEGRLTDTQGREADFTNTTIIMTANTGKNNCGNIGFGETGSVVTKLGSGFSKEFLARIDDIVEFETPDVQVLQAIVRKRLEELRTRMVKRDCHVEFSDDLAREIAEKSFARHLGVRPVAEYVRVMVENPLADMILSGTDLTEPIYFNGEELPSVC